MSMSVTQFPDVRRGLAAELDALQEVADGAPPRAMIWTAVRAALTLPERFSRAPSFDAAAAGSEAAGWPVTPRRTGGGITPQGPGVVNVAIAFRVPAKDARSVHASYAAICNPLSAAFSDLGVRTGTGSVRGSFCDGDYNLETGGRKIVGTAQRWRGAAVLCHALVLVDLDLGAAVAAAQSLSDALALGDTYTVDAHVRLADVAKIDGRADTAFARSCGDALMRAGFASN